MDGCADDLRCEIGQVGKGLVELLKKALCPAFVQDGGMILQASPWEEADYRIGVYLYDIQDYSFAAASGMMAGENKKRFPPKALELSYMIFCNEDVRFGGIRRDQIQMHLNEVGRTLHDFPAFETERGEEIQLSFSRETIDFKIRLWGSFNRPLRPALYVRAVPVLVESDRIADLSRVGERDYRVGKK